MAVLGRLLISSAERLDLPDFLSIDSYTQGDFKYLMKSFVGSDRPYVLTGFDVINPGAAIGTQNISVRVADSVVYYPESLAGPFFHGLEEGNTLAAPLVPELRKNSTNYVYLTLDTTEAAQDTRAFWDPDKEGGEGGEFTQDINTQTALVSTINVSTSSFPEDTVPVCIVEVGPNFITSIEDARDMMFRLGTGGLSPDPLATYAFREDPTGANARLEPNTLMTNALDPNAFQGGDKNILSLKEWMDVVMTKLKELSGTTYWYEDTSTYNLVNIFKDALSTSIKSKGVWQSSDSTPGLLTWTEDILVQSVSDNKDRIVRAGNKTLADNQTMYMPLVRRADINSGGVSVNWFNGLNYVNGTLGSFENLTKGDWIKKSDDPDYRYLRVEEFYADENLAGGVTAPGNALSIKLSDTYGGISELKRGVYDKGVYLSSEVVIGDRDDATLSDLGGDLYWLAMRSDTIMSVADITTTTLSIDITNDDGLTAKVTSAAHGLVDGQRVGISGTTNFDGEYDIEVEDANTFYINTSLLGGPHPDEVGQSAFYATVTTQARSTVDGLQLESENHGFSVDQTIQVGDTTNYDGTYKVYPTGNTTFTIPVTSAIANETAGTATAVTVYVRTDIGPTKLDQGENKQIGESESENIMSFIGMDNATQTHPSYHIPPDYNTLDGQQNYNGDPTDNLTQRVSKLTAMMADKAQDKTIILAPSGYITVNNVLNGTARDITFTPAPSETPRLDIVLPSSDQNNDVTLTGTISLETNQAAYVQIDRNDPQSFLNLAAVSIADITAVPLEENTIVLAVRLGTDEVWLWDGFYVSGGITPVPNFLSQVVVQDRNAKLIEGGTWSWDLVAENLTLSADAYLQITGITDTRNTIQAQSINLANDGDIAYVEINRSAGGATNLTVTVAQNDSFAATLDTFVIARRIGDTVLVGNGTFLLKDGEYLEIDGALAEINRFFGQLKLVPENPNSQRVRLTGSDVTKLDASVLGQELAGLVMKFDGALINFNTGVITESDGITPLGQNFTPATIAANQWRWYSVSLIPNTVDTENRISAQVLVLPGDADGATQDAADRGVYGGTKKIGQVAVQDNGAGGAGTILNIGYSNIQQLGTGSGGGGSAAPKMIGGGTFAWDLGATELSFTSDVFIEQARLDYADNTIDQATVSPITLPTTNHVAFIDRLNASSGGGNLTVNVDLITNVKDGQIIIARRDGNDVIVGSTSNRLRDGESAKLFAQRSNFTNQDAGAKLIGGGTVSWTAPINEAFGSQPVDAGASAGIWIEAATEGLSYPVDPSQSGSINTVELSYVANGLPDCDMILEFRDASGIAPGPTILGTSDPVSTVGLSNGPVKFTFSTPIAVNLGTIYHASVRPINIVTLDAGNRFEFRDNNADSVPSRNIYQTTNSGTSWSFLTGRDWYWVLSFEQDASLDLSSDAYVQVPGLTDTSNTIQAQSIQVAGANDVAYVSLNRTDDTPTNLTVSVADINTVDDTDDDLHIFARADGGDILVGNQSMRLISGESKAIDAGVSNQILNAIAAEDNADDSGQARLKATSTPSTVVDVTSVTKNVPDGTEYGIQLKNLLLDFTGATIDFATGTVSTGINFTPVTIAANQWRWHSVTMLPGTVGVDGKIAGQLLVLPATADGATKDAAIRAPWANGIPIGQVAVQDNGAGGAGTVLNIEQDDILQLTTAGGASGEGNADELLERLSLQLDGNNFEFVGYNIFRLDEDDKVDGSSTGSFDIANGVYDVDTGQIMTSIQMLGSEFLTPSADPDTADEDPRDIPQVELTVFWDPENIDNAATYEVSRMGGQGSTWQTIDMERVGATDTYRGIHEFTDEGVLDTLADYTGGTPGVTDFEGLAANANISNATAFTTTATSVITNFRFYYDKLGSPTGFYQVSLVADDGGNLPSTDPADILAVSDWQDITSLGASGIADVSIPATALEAGTYHMVISTDISYQTSYNNGVDELRVQVDTAGGGVDLSQFDRTTELWSALVGTSMQFEVEGRVLDLRVRITSSQDSSLAGYGIFYDGESGLITGIKNRHKEQFDGIADNENEWTISFMPDPDLLRVYEVETGQVYVHGSFTLDGRKVTFPADTFNKVGTVTLIFDQSWGTSFDNADINGALLAANRLGSTDPAADRSVAGEGILLRADNGTLVEASIRWTGAVYEWVFSEV